MKTQHDQRHRPLIQSFWAVPFAFGFLGQAGCSSKDGVDGESADALDAGALDGMNSGGQSGSNTGMGTGGIIDDGNFGGEPSTNPSLPGGPDPDDSGEGTGGTDGTGGMTPASPEPVTPVEATYLGVHTHESFSSTFAEQDFWTFGDILYTAPQGRVTNEQANLWLAWYVRADELYRVVSGRDNFDDVFRANTAWGRKKIVAVVAGDTCGAGCGNKGKAETTSHTLDQMLLDPDDYEWHWILFYEMGRGGWPEPWYGKATWPSNTVLLPHLMAGLTYFELGGGEEGLRDKYIPGELLAELERWEQADIEYVDHFVASDQQKVGDFTSHHLMPGMLWKIRMETDLETVGRITANMATKPDATSGHQAMCDFRSAVNDATDGAFDARMIGPWGLPDDC